MGIIDIAHKAKIRDKVLEATREAKNKSPRKLKSFREIVGKDFSRDLADKPKRKLPGSSAKRKLTESSNKTNDIKSSLFAMIPQLAPDRETTIAEIVDGLRLMNAKQDIFLTVIGIDGDMPSSAQ